MVKRRIHISQQQRNQMHRMMYNKLARKKGNGFFDSVTRFMRRGLSTIGRVSKPLVSIAKSLAGKYIPKLAPLALKAAKDLISDKVSPAIAKELSKNKNKLDGIPERLLGKATDLLTRQDGAIDRLGNEIIKGVDEWSKDTKKKTNKTKVKPANIKGLQSKKDRLEELQKILDVQTGQGMVKSKSTKGKKGKSLYTFSGSSLYGF